MKFAILYEFCIDENFKSCGELEFFMKIVPFQTAEKSWELNSGFGNHRIIVKAEINEYTEANVQWRRRDIEPELVGVKVIYLATGEEIFDVFIKKATRENGEIIFKSPYEGKYAIYYMPFKISGPGWWVPEVRYLKPEEMNPSEDWINNIPDTLTKAEILKIECRTEFDSFYPMEVPMTEDEKSEFLSNQSAKPFVTIAESRTQPVRMFYEMPAIWSKRENIKELSDIAYANEYYVFQAVLYAKENLTNIRIYFSDENGMDLTDSCTCFTLGGKDCFGKTLKHSPEVQAGEILPLWCGIDLEKIHTNRLTLHTVIHTSNGDDTVKIHLEIKPEMLSNKGCDDLWRLSRLFWLNSDVGIDNESAFGYTDIEFDENTVSCLGRRVIFGKSGLPQKIQSFFTKDGCSIQDEPTDILSAPIELKLLQNKNPLQFINKEMYKQRKGSGSVLIAGQAENDLIDANIKTIMEYDGHLDTLITLTPKTDFTGSLVLSIPYSKETSDYMIGLGREGGFRPAKWFYKWNENRTNNTCWIGAPNAGVQVKIKHSEDVWEICSYQKVGLPKLWYNEGRGGITIKETDNGVFFNSNTGEYTFKKGVVETLRFSLIITPLKPIAYQAHFKERYHHITTYDSPIPPLEDTVSAGATVVNLHQGGALNQYINYPFLCPKELKKETSKAHKMGLKYKLYYTVRELSNHASELWTLRTLGDEVLRNGPGFHVADHFSEDRNVNMTGGPWLCEHLVEGFIPAWQQILADEDYDSAVAMNGISRWHNHYIEGLSYLIRELGIDGLYLDGVGYDRQIMKRVRKVMDRARPGCLIDFHSGNNYNPAYGLANPISQYLELMPSIDSLWLGEGFDYEDKSYDYWLTEVSGIPFGLMGDMLQNGGNAWRGMVFGMTPRYGWQQGGNPVPIWKFWDKYNLGEAQMIGWWNRDCPIICQNNEIKVTVFKEKNQIIAAVASWYPKDIKAGLVIDKEALNLPKQFKFYAPYIEGFQVECEFDWNELIPFEAHKGWLFLIKE